MDVVDTNSGKTIKKQNAVKRFFNKLGRGLKKAGKVIVGRTIPQRLFRLYLIIILIGALLLAAPFCLQKVDGIQLNGYTNAGGKYSFLQALFIACSGFSDTGLTPVPIYSYLNVGGQVVLAILIEVGGIGVVALFYYVWNFFKKKQDKIDVGQLYIMQAERGGSKLSESFRVIKTALAFILITQVIFMFLYSFCFCFIPAYEQQFQRVFGYDAGISFDNLSKPLNLYHNYGKSLWISLFTTISAMNNAGFDNISATSMAPYRNDWGIILQVLIIFELVIGGLGHFVWFDIIEKINCNRKHIPYKMTLYSKVAITVYWIVAVIGIAAMFGTEVCDPATRYSAYNEFTIYGNTNSNGEFGKHPGLNKAMTVIFGSFNCRSLGMETVKTDYFANSTKWVMSILMFIGASPSSTAGGIRTTTLAVIFITIFCKLLGRKNVFFFKRRISDDTVTQAFMIFIISLVLIIIGVPILASATPCPAGTDPTTWYKTPEYVTELCSAFGTVGLSAGITSVCKWWGLLYLVLLMFVGQLGVINTLLSWTRFHPHFNDVQYPYEDIKIG